MNIPRSSLRTGRYCNSLNYEGIAVIELQFYHFPDSDRLRVVGHSSRSFSQISSYGSVNHQGIILHIIVLHQRLLFTCLK